MKQILAQGPPQGGPPALRPPTETNTTVFDISPVQIMIVLAIALLILGPERLPDPGRNLGSGISGEPAPARLPPV